MLKLIFNTIFLILHIKLHLSKCENLSVLSTYVSSGISIQCPITGDPNKPNTLLSVNDILWLNEVNQSDKPDSDVIITNEIFLSKGNLIYDLKSELNYLSCGYFGTNGKYVRIKQWKFDYVKDAMIELTYTLDEDILKIKSFNQSYYELKLNKEIDSFTPSGKLFQLGCKNNYDIPLSTSLIWLNLMRFNQSILTLNERWNKYFTNRTENDQFFYNADTKTTHEFGYFLKLIKNDDSYRMNLQCVSYVFGNTIVKESNDFYIIKSKQIGNENESKLSKTALILIIVFSIIGFILIVALILLLFFCWRRKKQNDLQKSAKKIQYENNENTIEVLNSDQEDLDRAEKVFRSSIRIKPAIELPSNQNTLVRSSASDLYSNNLVLKKDPFTKLDDFIHEENYTQYKIFRADKGEYYEKWTNATMTPESSFHNTNERIHHL